MDISNMTNEEFDIFVDTCFYFQFGSPQSMREYLKENQVSDFVRSVINYLIDSYRFRVKDMMDEYNKK